MKQWDHAALEVIAIDGPGGVGKSTVARALGDALGYYFLSSGMIYRAMAWYLLQRGWEVEAPVQTDALQGFSMRIDGTGGLSINDQMISADLNTEEISRAASLMSALPEIRDLSNQVQRETVSKIAADSHFPGVILEGRDIGTVVFPNARHKFFLTASEAVRSERRFQEKAGETPGLTREAVQAALRERDLRDQTREIAPLKAAENALQVDTSNLSLDEVVETLLAAVLAKSKSE